MHELDQLTSAQMREAAEVLRTWAAERQHDAQVAAEVLDQAAVDEAAEAAQRVEVVRAALMAAAIRLESDEAAKVAAATQSGAASNTAR